MNKYNTHGMLKVLMIGTTDSMGGAAGIGWTLGHQMRKSGISVKYLVGYKRSRSSYVYELRQNKLLSYLESHSKYNFVSLIRSARTFILSNDIDFGASNEILNHPWFKEADIIHLHNLHGYYFKLQTLVAIINQKPTIWTLHDMWPITSSCTQCIDCVNYNKGNHFTYDIHRYNAMLWNNSKYLWNKKRKIYNNLSKIHIVVPSLWLANKVKTSILGRKPLSIISNGIDTEIFKFHDKNIAKDKFKIPRNKKIVLYIGQMGSLDLSKGSKYFLDAATYFKNDPNILFLCLGGTGGKESVQKDNIIYTPYILDKRKLALYYSSADMLLVTSLAESFSLVAAEAIASGIPVVSFDVGGIKEMINHKENGYIARYRDTADVIKGIKYILSLSKLSLTKISHNNRSIAIKKFSSYIMTKNYLNLYRSILRKERLNRE